MPKEKHMGLLPTYFTPETTVRFITRETKRFLKQKKLWDQSEGWTSEVMKELAALSGKQYQFLTFEQVVLAVKIFVPERAISLMNEYSLAVQDDDDIKDAFEYAAVLHQENVLKALLDQHRNKAVLQEWIVVYSLFLENMVEGKSNPEVIIHQVIRELRGAIDRVEEECALFRQLTSMLTSKEIEVLQNIHKGYKRREIAKTMYTSEHTVKSHIRNILTKMGADNIKEAAATAHKANILQQNTCHNDKKD
ncbi:helix-turn-helix transcriptional regulator [Shouchella lonarensis]|uniref:Regulatory protein, luxR family n=1 Tax=Shouchella lonarensis TaxID=1464122 RepID=A0A1G6HPK0_9BACI|nr:LuxR C-terminal-related transcriptional regulator [Shouchella lonarensis]SDB96073.1 regulatory protein, luxR family [Shouchella lonarensis]